MIIVFIISFVMFDVIVNMYTTSYLIVLGAVLFACVLNKTKGIEIVTLITSNVIAFIFAKYCKVHALPVLTFGKIAIGIIDMFLSMFMLKNITSDYINIRDKKVSENDCTDEQISSEVLFPTRLYDYKRLKLYYEHDSVIGLIGSWGSGKSFIVDRFITDKKSEFLDEGFEVVKIGLLELNSNKPENVFFWSVDNILRKYGQFTRYSRAVSNIVSRHDVLGDIETAIFPNYEVMDDAVRNIKKALCDLEIEVLFVIEDLDRLQDADKIRTILAFCDRLSGNKIKFILEYDEQKLEEIDCTFSYDYIEKFIPNTVDLSPVPITEMIATYLGIDELDFHKGNTNSGFENIIYDFIKRLDIINYRVNDLLKAYKLFDFINEEEFYVDSVRSVINFLSESRKLLESDKNNIYVGDLKVKAIIGIIFLKYFDHISYEKLKVINNYLVALSIECEDRKYTLKNFLDVAGMYRIKTLKRDEEADDSDWIAMRKILLKVLHDQKHEVINLFRAAYILGYEYLIPGAKHIAIDKNEYNNMEIDHIIRNYLFNGLSEFTDHEAFVKKLNSILDINDITKRNEQFSKILENYYYGNTYKDNRTVFLIGIDSYCAIVKAYLVCERRVEYWVKLLDYIEYKIKDDEIKPQRFSMLYFISEFSNVEVFKRGIKLFLLLKYDVNYNQNKEYILFVTEYLKMMVYHGFINDDRFELFYTDVTDIKTMEDLKTYLRKSRKYLINELSFFENRKLTNVVEDYILLLRFIKANEEIINKQQSYKPHSPIKETITMHYEHKNPDLYKELEQSGTNEKIDKAYENGEISIVELHRLTKEPTRL